MRPVGAGGPVVGDGEMLGHGGIARSEPTTVQERDLHGGKKPGRGPTFVTVWAGLVRKRGQVFNFEAAGGLDGGAEGKREDGGCVFASGLLTKAGERVLHEDG